MPQTIGLDSIPYFDHFCDLSRDLFFVSLFQPPDSMSAATTMRKADKRREMDLPAP
jgi:hypothetical protein